MGVGPRDALRRRARARTATAGPGSKPEHARALAREPGRAEAEPGAELLAARGRHVAEHRGVEDHQRRVLRRLGGERARGRSSGRPRSRAAGRAGRSRPRCAASRAVLLPGPDQQLEPAHLLGVGDVDRVEVQPGAPDDLGQRLRQRRRRPRARSAGMPVAEAVAVVVVAVAVGQQAQPGARADLEQRQRLRERARAAAACSAQRAASLVCVRRSSITASISPRRSLQRLPELGPAARRAGTRAGRRRTAGSAGACRAGGRRAKRSGPRPRPRRATSST